MRVQKTHSQSFGHAGSAIIGRRPTHAEDNRAGPVIQSMHHKLAGSVCGGDKRVPGAFGNELDAAGSRHLDHRGFVLISRVAKDAIFHRRLELQRIQHLCAAHMTLGGVHQGTNRAFAAVGHGHHHIFGVREHPQQSRANGLTGLFCRHAPLEGIRRDHEFHSFSFIHYHPRTNTQNTMYIKVATQVMVRPTNDSNGTLFMRSPTVIFMACAVTWK